MKRQTYRLAAWLAFLAILLSSLAPSITHALTAADHSGQAWSEICTSPGIRLVAPSNQTNPATPAPPDQPGHSEQCPFCFTHAGSAALPPGGNPMRPLVIGPPALPILFYQSKRPLFAWTAKQARAPPAAS